MNLISIKIKFKSVDALKNNVKNVINRREI